MDLFGRKAKLELLKAHIAQRALQQRLATVERQLLLEREAATAKIHAAEVEVARLEERLKPFQASASPQRLYKTEEEEEAEYAFQHGHITRDELETQLRKAGFDNTQIEFAPEVSDIVY